MIWVKPDFFCFPLLACCGGREGWKTGCRICGIFRCDKHPLCCNSPPSHSFAWVDTTHKKSTIVDLPGRIRAGRSELARHITIDRAAGALGEANGLDVGLGEQISS